jgi:hypothetical protein
MLYTPNWGRLKEYVRVFVASPFEALGAAATKVPP